MEDYEKPGQFYLGKLVNPTTGKLENSLLLYDSKDLTTHAVCVGMTGSGKTGLGITILEEAALDGIPAIIIDPKGDLSNLLLTFPELSPEEFLPWVDPTEAEKKGVSTKEYAASVAKTWTDGLAQWGEDKTRIQKLRKSVDLAVYTPASQAGIPISILSSFAAPSKEEILDTTALRDRIQTLTSSLLGLLGIDADPIKSREHILISSILQQAWQSGKDLDIATLIQQVQKPSFAKIGAMDVDTFYPAKERMNLSISLNNLLASPGFQAWMEGEPLDINQMLYSGKNKPKLSIISIAHLNDSERMFFVTLLLNEFLSWMRRQSGTSNLRTILYMDEIFGFFPPTAAPPSKLPMLTLLKQARAFGVGIVLCTQNPVDLDYKGLANCGTWFIGKLQTERDKARVIEGLKTASNGDLDGKSFDQMLSLTGNRRFIMRSVHQKDPVLFETRWTLSYMRGPLTLPQIATLVDKSAVKNNANRVVEKVNTPANSKPATPPGIEEYFANPQAPTESVHYKPKIVGIAKLHFVDSKTKTDVWQDVCIAASSEADGKQISWDSGSNILPLKEILKREPQPNSTFEDLPAGLMQEKNYAAFAKDFATFLYQNQTFLIYESKDAGLLSKSGESEADFRLRVLSQMNEKRDDAAKKIREKYASKISSLNDRLQRAQGKMEEKQQKAWMQKIQTFITFLTTLISAFFGKKLTKGTINQAGTTLRRASQMGKDSQGAAQAEESVTSCQQQLKDTQEQMNEELSALDTPKTADSVQLETITLRPRKSDINVEKVALIWWARS